MTRVDSFFFHLSTSIDTNCEMSLSIEIQLVKGYKLCKLCILHYKKLGSALIKNNNVCVYSRG